MTQKMRNHTYPLKTGINRTPEFEKKKLCSYSVNPGIKCGHDCLYCSTGAMMRMHPAFKFCGENPFGHGYSICDPTTPDRVSKDAKRIKKRGLVQLSTICDAWAPEAGRYKLGKRCLEAILTEPGWSVRILTKNISVMNDFDLIERYRDRVLVGISITATTDKNAIIKVLEPNASSIIQRTLAMLAAANRGFRTYAMLCPLMPSIADDPKSIDRLIQFATNMKVEEIFAEPLNPRGPGLKHCQEALERKGYEKEADAFKTIRKRKNWSHYVVNLVKNVQQAVRKHSDIEKLRFLLYPSGLTPEDKALIKKDGAGVIWL
jgi:DNA repair photolyase